MQNNDLISRKALLAEYDRVHIGEPGGARNLIAEAPTVDAVPVVRCKDCQNYHAELGWCDEHSHFIDADGAFCHPWESTEWKMFDPDYFCADGARMDGDG